MPATRAMNVNVNEVDPDGTKKRRDAKPSFFEESKVDTDKKRKTANEKGLKEGGEPTKSFEINAHNFFLTYSGLTEEESSKEKMLEFITDKTLNNGGLVEYSIGKEKHTNPTNPERA